MMKFIFFTPKDVMSSGPILKLHQLVDAFGMAPGIRHYRQRAAHGRFLNNVDRRNLFHGVFSTYDEALANVPDVLPVGYNNDHAAMMYQHVMEPNDRDYPAMFWLEKSMHEGMRSVVDLGGSIGIKYYAFSKYLSMPANLSWTVCDTSVVVKNGRDFAEKQGVSHILRFTDEYADMSGVDVLYASGSVQYLPKPLSEVIADLAVKPKRILVNTAAIHPSKDFYTINHIGSAYCPYRVQSVDRIVKDVQAQGYRLLTKWHHPEKRLDLPFNPGYSLETYMGFCFDRIE